LIGVLVLASSCAAGTAATVPSAALGLAVGVAAAGVSRSAGGCYASCPPGTSCNAGSGMCDELPCHGRCGGDEVCDMNRPVPTCVAAHEPDLQIGRSKEEPERVTPQ
ncbi:MAG: hypothetical protein ACYC8T_31125, partial [Myxococcaceae bacterium]